MWQAWIILECCRYGLRLAATERMARYCNVRKTANAGLLLERGIAFNKLNDVLRILDCGGFRTMPQPECHSRVAPQEIAHIHRAAIGDHDFLSASVDKRLPSIS
jgi:hypothetical protein